ncbi:hypothetical protein H920_09608 [Fukomys damarensis]|uniref:Uncharacterized protein n=1 Tax=Fukomys damarensis TaxID=885580 RepID=A0A091DEM3_FUKDA|nr:hypothetical protein H920_09608 [Fukomys damarensis]
MSLRGGFGGRGRVSGDRRVARWRRDGRSSPGSRWSSGEAASSEPASSEHVQCPQPGDQVANSATPKCFGSRPLLSRRVVVVRHPGGRTLAVAIDYGSPAGPGPLGPLALHAEPLAFDPAVPSRVAGCRGEPLGSSRQPGTEDVEQDLDTIQPTSRLLPATPRRGDWRLEIPRASLSGGLEVLRGVSAPITASALRVPGIQVLATRVPLLWSTWWAGALDLDQAEGVAPENCSRPGARDEVGPP